MPHDPVSGSGARAAAGKVNHDRYCAHGWHAKTHINAFLVASLATMTVMLHLWRTEADSRYNCSHGHTQATTALCWTSMQSGSKLAIRPKLC